MLPIKGNGARVTQSWVKSHVLALRERRVSRVRLVLNAEVVGQVAVHVQPAALSGQQHQRRVQFDAVALVPGRAALDVGHHLPLGGVHLVAAAPHGGGAARLDAVARPGTLPRKHAHVPQHAAHAHRRHHHLEGSHGSHVEHDPVVAVVRQLGLYGSVQGESLGFVLVQATRRVAVAGRPFLLALLVRVYRCSWDLHGVQGDERVRLHPALPQREPVGVAVEQRVVVVVLAVAQNKHLMAGPDLCDGFELLPQNAQRRVQGDGETVILLRREEPYRDVAAATSHG
mmetsp:Transcript_12713/g.24118  ORF Transcript_12713/g.24118 Transcript_12713/m.24118 type:complete len:285 (+) Transcript_12713:551-1405(+)